MKSPRNPGSKRLILLPKIDLIHGFDRRNMILSVPIVKYNHIYFALYSFQKMTR